MNLSSRIEANPVLALFAGAEVDDLSQVHRSRPPDVDSAFGVTTNAPDFLHSR